MLKIKMVVYVLLKKQEITWLAKQFFLVKISGLQFMIPKGKKSGSKLEMGRENPIMK